MPDPETPSAAPSGSAGIPEATFSALGSAIDFLSLRFDLAQVEAKEAGRAILDHQAGELARLIGEIAAMDITGFAPLGADKTP